MNQLEPDAVLPALRSELRLMPGIREVNGLKTWLIFDPVRHQYYQIDNKTRLILSYWSRSKPGEIADRLMAHDVTLEDIESLVRFLWLNSLTISPPAGDNSFFSNHNENKKKHWSFRILHGYLFFILPLFRPRTFLKKTEPLTRIFFTRLWIYTIVIIAIAGLYLVSRQWDLFVRTFMHFFTLQGLLYYAIALVFVKVAHESGHAYAATRYGCRVKSIGMAFIVMFPVLYTDTSDSWKLTSKKQRLIIGAAGVAVELSLAAIATLIWVFAADGPLRSAAFFIATTSWILSIFINMNPLMRFDAYYFVSDAIGIQNLQSRCFALGRWRLREILFGLKEPLPEAMPKKYINGLCLFSWATWIYRFFLFLGIAVLVHQLFFRPFGTILAVIEILFFIGLPIMNEIKQWYERRWMIVTKPNSWITLTAVCCLILAFFFPWQSNIRMPAVLDTAEKLDLYAPVHAKIQDILVSQGDEVAENQILMQLESDELTNQSLLAKREIDLRQALLNRIAADDIDLEQRTVLQSELKSFQEELTGLETQINLLTVKAPFAGTIGDLSSNMHVDRWIGKDMLLLTVNSQQGAKVRGFVDRSNLARLKQGSDAVFIPDMPEMKKVSGIVKAIDSANVEHLNVNALASHYGGPIAVGVTEDSLQPFKAWYHVNIDTTDASLKHISQQSRGIILAKGSPESIAVRLWRRIFHVLLREIFI